MPSGLENSDAGTQRTRRNIVKLGAIVVPATLGTVHSAAAGELCIFGICIPLPPLGGHPPSGGRGHNCFLKGTKIFLPLEHIAVA
jgi:hypothetical protein